MVGLAALGIAVVIVLALAAPAGAQTYNCRGYPPSDVTASLKAQVEAMRKIEIEVADRIRGLDTRPYPWLLEQARAAENAIAVPALMKAEDSLFERCRNAVRPVRRGCAAGAAALVEVLTELAATGEVRKESRHVYVQTMPLCERWLGLSPQQSGLRTEE